MKRQAKNLSLFLERQLGGYALAASAAGVGVLALAQPAEAKVIYTKTHHVIGTDGVYRLSLNHESAEFVIFEQGHPSWGSNFLDVRGLGDNAVEGSYINDKRSAWASALSKGSVVGPKRTFVGNGKDAVMARYCCSTGWSGNLSGPWASRPNGYLGLKFRIDKKFHYGWAHLSVQFPEEWTIRATLTGYAYETIPNKPIIAGKTKGPDVITVQPASLGRLAQGSAGLAAWRKKETTSGRH